MEIREYVTAILENGGLEAKLTPPEDRLSDRSPGKPRIIHAPARDRSIRIRPGREVKVPSREGMCDPAQRIRLIHAFANHELQAVELFAWALLAFPAAGAEFRSSLVRILSDEQRHTRMYLKLLARRSVGVGAIPGGGDMGGQAAGWCGTRRLVCAM